jgi:hypothetical protein
MVFMTVVFNFLRPFFQTLTAWATLIENGASSQFLYSQVSGVDLAVGSITNKNGALTRPGRSHHHHKELGWIAIRIMCVEIRLDKPT